MGGIVPRVARAGLQVGRQVRKGSVEVEEGGGRILQGVSMHPPQALGKRVAVVWVLGHAGWGVRGRLGVSSGAGVMVVVVVVGISEALLQHWVGGEGVRAHAVLTATV